MITAGGAGYTARPSKPPQSPCHSTANLSLFLFLNLNLFDSCNPQLLEHLHLSPVPCRYTHDHSPIPRIAMPTLSAFITQGQTHYFPNRKPSQNSSRLQLVYLEFTSRDKSSFLFLLFNLASPSADNLYTFRSALLSSDTVSLYSTKFFLNLLPVRNCNILLNRTRLKLNRI